MMNKAPNSLRRLARTLFENPGTRQEFIDCLLAPRPPARAVLWLQERPQPVPFRVMDAVAWQPDFIDRVPPDEPVGATLHHQAGAYYCLETSSVFCAVPILLLRPGQELVVDMCASPGGKTMFCCRALRPKQILCNEVIKKRTGALIANLRRCRIHPCMVLSCDSSWFVHRWAASAGLVIVDAPCSGQSLVAKGKRSPGCFHPATMNMNSNRQKRILANSAPLVAPGGHLAYMTCTYSVQENERVVAWLREKFPWFVPIEVPWLKSHQSHLTELPCYRLWPQEGIGAGAFVAILENQAEGTMQTPDISSLRPIWRSSPAVGG